MTPFGVYIHIPFCARRCDYCAFATWTDKADLMTAYAAACQLEIGRAELRPATSIFFGGGTPSLLPAPLLIDILDAIPRMPGAEITVECNPESVTLELLESLRGAGVNRLSFGVQSMVEHVLTGLGRAHDPASVTRAVAAGRAIGFDRFNVDLIYGAVGERERDWARTLDATLALGPSHVSAYALTVEPGTPLAADAARHPDDDTQADRYLMAEEVLGAAGFANYEISNWAQPGNECRHNLLYWCQGDYRGIGCAAHSHERGRRWWNLHTPGRYIDAVTSGSSVVAGSETLDRPARRREALRLALRTREGVPAGAFSDDDLALFEERGLVSLTSARVVLTASGRLLANQVAVRLRDGWEDDAHPDIEQIGIGRIG